MRARPAPACGTVSLHGVRVQYMDTDQGSIVHHASYLRYLEAARIEYLRERGLDYRRFETEDLMGLPVVEAKLRYRLPARFDQQLVIETWCALVTRARVRFDAVITHAGAVLNESEVTVVCVRLPEGKIRSMAEKVVVAVGR